MASFLICEFGKPTISNLVKECYGSAFPDIYDKKQVDYLYRYLRDLGAECVLLETEYVDKDYLDDYTKFYAHRFGSRGHRCARLHFFSQKYSHTEFEGLLDNGQPSTMVNDTYLGFLVVKPLPKTFIGKTCLRLYSRLRERTPKRVVLRRRYDVNLFGLDLSVESIGFQEQDKVVSACATTSIWCALQALDWKGVRDMPSCGEITANAINFIDGSSNSFPRGDLTNKQMLRALDAEGLRHHVHSLNSASLEEAKRIISTYLESGLPLILGADVYRLIAKTGSRLADHATTIVGYDFGGADPCLYVHDDRFGPFARARFVELEGFQLERRAGQIAQKWALVLQEKDDSGAWVEPAELLIPTMLIGMTHKKVRIPLDMVVGTCDRVRQMHGQAAEALRQSQLAGVGKSDWGIGFDIKLREVSTIKRDIRHSSFEADPDLDDEQNAAWKRRHLNQKIALLTKSMARFQWVADFYFEERLAFTIFIDATDIPQGDAVSEIYERSPTNMAAIVSMVRAVAGEAVAKSGEGQSFINSFLRRLTPVVSGLQHHLDSTFGVPGAPVRLKAAEIEQGDVRSNATVRRFYEPVNETIDQCFPALESAADPYLIWVIDFEGTLLVGQEVDSMGHPTLTGFKPARIAGELRKADGRWVLNSKSGRYSASYENSRQLLENALKRFQSVFPASQGDIQIQST